RNPTTGIAGCCARAARGHAAAVPPSAASNSRRPMVTVIRPSRARCVKATIPRHQRAVFTFKEDGMVGRWVHKLSTQLRFAACRRSHGCSFKGGIACNKTFLLLINLGK